VAAALRDETDVNVQLADGSKGEFTVLVDSREVFRKSSETLPEINEVVAAVKRAPAPAGAMR
jgi:hypothetical protein